MHLWWLGEHRIQRRAEQRFRAGIIESRPGDGERQRRQNVEPGATGTPFPEEQQKQEESEVEAARRAHEDSDALGRTKSEQETKPLLAAEEHVKR